MSDITHYFADVILPDEIEIFANEAGRQAIENLVDGRVEWDDFAIEARDRRIGNTGNTGTRSSRQSAGQVGTARDHHRQRQSEIIHDMTGGQSGADGTVRWSSRSEIAGSRGIASDRA
jgi:hypothetical protein